MLKLFANAVATGLPAVLGWWALLNYARLLPRRRALGWAGLAGVVLAGVVTVLQRDTTWFEREQASLVLAPIGVLACVALLVFLWLPRSHAATASTLAGVIAATILVQDLPDLFQTAGQITASGGSLLTTGVVMQVSGYALGLILLGVLVWVGHRAGARCDAVGLRVATTLALAMSLVGGLTTIAQILIARGLVEVPDSVFSLVVWLVNHQSWVSAGMGVACLIPAGVAMRRRPTPPVANPAEARLARAAGISRRRFLTATALSAVAVALTAVVVRPRVSAEPGLSPLEPLQGDARDVWVELAAIRGGHLHRFGIAAKDSTEVRFIALEKVPNVFVAALDACSICGPAGYYEHNGQIICRRCGVAMNISTIGFTGGCNPIPVRFTVADGRLTIARSVLEADASVFQ